MRIPIAGASLTLVLAAFLALFVFAAPRPNDHVSITIDETSRRVDVTIDGKPFTYYIWPITLKKPVLYPLRTDKGTVVTRGYPLEQRPGERIDHPHHAGLWFNYEDVNGIDFWNNSDAIKPDQAPKMGTIFHRSIVSTKSGEHGELDVETEWVTFDKKVLLNEHTHFVFRGAPGFRSVDHITTLTALDSKVNFPDAKDGMLGLRVVRALEIPSEKPDVYTDASGRPTVVAKLDNTGVNGTYLTSEAKKATPPGARAVVGATSAAWSAPSPSPHHSRSPRQSGLPHLLARPRLRSLRRQSPRPKRFQRRQAGVKFFSGSSRHRHIPLPHLDHFGYRHARSHRSRLQRFRRHLSLANFHFERWRHRGAPALQFCDSALNR